MVNAVHRMRLQARLRTIVVANCKLPHGQVVPQILTLLEEVSRLLSAYASAILASHS